MGLKKAVIKPPRTPKKSDGGKRGYRRKRGTQIQKKYRTRVLMHQRMWIRGPKRAGSSKRVCRKRRGKPQGLRRRTEGLESLARWLGSLTKGLGAAGCGGKVLVVFEGGVEVMRRRRGGRRWLWYQEENQNYFTCLIKALRPYIYIQSILDDQEKNK